VTGIDLPGEAKGIVINRNQVKPIDIATMSMGQSIAVTPIQLLTAVSAVANGGWLNRPQIVKEIRDHNGSVIRGFQTDTKYRVLDDATVGQMKGILENVVEQGTGRNAYVEGMRIAGKTGTGQKVGGGGYLPDKYVASFIGFAPADNPVVALLVIIDEPVGLYYGGQIAAPVFGRAIKDILQYYKIAPDKRLHDTSSLVKAAHIEVPSVLNLSLDEAAEILHKAGLGIREAGNSGRVMDQIPKPGSRVPPKTTVLLYTERPRYIGGKITVPDLTGKGLPEAMGILSDTGLKISLVGSGSVITKQYPGPGVLVEMGTVVNLYLNE